MDINTNSKYVKKATDLFMEGYNCAQSVFLAFNDTYNLDFNTALKLSSSFGGGMGKLREVCGGVSGMFMVAGLLYGYDNPKDDEKKAAHYKRLQYLANQFKEKEHTIICRELLGITDKEESNKPPQKRDKEYYESRPCLRVIALSASIMEEYILTHER